MRLRPYRKNDDFKYIQQWIKDEYTHALWCANIIPYPISFDSFHAILHQYENDWGDCAYVFTDDTGQPIGFLSYSVNEKDNCGFVKFVVVSNELRGKGYGTQMLELLLKYAYTITGVSCVKLNVFNHNEAAKNCYKKAGFLEDSITLNTFSFKDKKWDRCLMIARKGN